MTQVATSSRRDWTIPAACWLMLLAVLVAFALLYLYNGRRIEADDFALGKQNTSRSEVWGELPMTAHSIDEIRALLTRQSAALRAGGGASSAIVWLGNSQLHTLNQYQSGQHLSPYWLRKQLPCTDCTVPLGLSLSNANPQEIHVLSRYAAAQVPVSLVILEVEFMGFREDAVRGDFRNIASPELLKDLGEHAVGRQLASLMADAEKAQQAVAASKQADGGIDGDFQKKVEAALSDGLADIWPLWRDRAYLRSTLLGDLFNLRNEAFGISSQSQRRVIRPRYIRNMAALEGMLHSFRRDGVPMLLYFAPVRPDKPLPYDQTEYGQWKTDVRELAARHGAAIVDLQRLVPAGDWGSNFGKDIDFMHFQEPGHKLVAQALLPLVCQQMEKACSSTR